MASRLTPTRQRNAVSEGVALGLLMLGRDAVPFEKWRVDLAFTGAWRDWDHRGDFRQVSTDLERGLDGYIALTRASDTKQTWAFYWAQERAELVIYARQSDWDPNDRADIDYALKVIGGNVSLDAWKSLASDFLARLDG